MYALTVRPGRAVPGSVVAVVLTAVAVAVTAVHAALLHLPVLDDAAISIAYGRSLYEGAGLRLTPSSGPVEGFSSPLWVVITGLSFPLSVDPLSFARWTGIGLGALALVFVPLAVATASGSLLEPQDAIGPLLVASVPNYAAWIASGMECGLYALLLGASCWALGRAYRLGRSAAAGVLLTLLMLTRPEAPLFIVAAAAIWGAWLVADHRAPGRVERTVIATVVVVALAYLLFRWSLFARLLPNTYYAKRSWDFGRAAYLLGFSRAHVVPLAASLALGLIGLAARTVRRPSSLALAFVLCGGVFAWWARGDWMEEWRFLSPLWPLLGMATVAGLRGLEERAAPFRRRPSALAVTAAVILGGVLASQLPRLRAVKASPGLAAIFVMERAGNVRARLDALGVVHARVGMPDVGGLGLILRREQIVDLGGLADHAMAEHADNLAAIEDYLIGEGLPEMLDLHGPSLRLEVLGRVLDRYRWGEAGVWELSGLAPGLDPRCPGGDVAAILHANWPELLERLGRFVNDDAPEQAVLLLRCLQAHRGSGTVPAKELAAISARALRIAERLEREGRIERALRHLSLATMLADENAHLRRRTERLRARLFPPSVDGSQPNDL